MATLVERLKVMKNLNYARYIYKNFHSNPIVLMVPKVVSKLELKKLIKNSSLVPVKMYSINLVNQGTHPDIFVSQKVLPGKYILTVSGYPYHIAKYENQYVLVGEDGINFQNIFGQNKAIATYDGDGNSHYSDGDIIEDDDKIILYYRMCYEDCDEPYITIFSRETYDMRKWSDEKIIVSKKGQPFLSPAIAKVCNMYHMYYVEFDGTSYWLKRRVSESPYFERDSDEIVMMEGNPTDRSIWHVDVVCNEAGLYGLFAFAEGRGGYHARLFEARSIDDGETWKIGSEIKLDLDYKYVDRVYRSSFVYKGNNYWDLYLAVKTNKDCWYILLKKEYIFSFDK